MEPVVERTAPPRVPVRVIEPARGAIRLDAIDRDAVIEAFRWHGWVVLRGFDVDPAAYDELARRFTARHFIGYGRVPFPAIPTITMGNETLLPLAPHCDNGIRAEEHRPDITWFWCDVPADVPADEGGETTLFDGIRVWNALRWRADPDSEATVTTTTAHGERTLSLRAADVGVLALCDGSRSGRDILDALRGSHDLGEAALARRLCFYRRAQVIALEAGRLTPGSSPGSSPGSR